MRTCSPRTRRLLRPRPPASPARMTVHPPWVALGFDSEILDPHPNLKMVCFLSATPASGPGPRPARPRATVQPPLLALGLRP